MQTYGRYVQAALVALSAAGVLCLWVLAERDGLFNTMRALEKSGTHVLPGTSEPLRKHYTGIGAIDRQLQVLMVFFYDPISGSLPACSIQTFHFGGQFAAAWMLIALEATRDSNQGTVLAFANVWGLLAQNIGFAITIPLYLAIHVGFSRAVKPELSAIMSPAPVLAALPISMTLGYIVPGILMGLPTPLVTSYDQKQIFSAIWQIFPITVQFTQRLLGGILPRFFSSLSPQQQDYKHIRRLLHAVYAWTTLVAGITHVAAVTLPVAYDLMPGLFHPYLQPISFRSTFVPSIVPLNLSSIAQIRTIGEGAHLFLQYDEIIGSTSMLLWATYVYVCSWDHVTFVKARVLALGLVALVGMLGPVGAAGALLWIRDEEALRNKAEEKH